MGCVQDHVCMILSKSLPFFDIIHLFIPLQEAILHIIKNLEQVLCQLYWQPTGGSWCLTKLLSLRTTKNLCRARLWSKRTYLTFKGGKVPVQNFFKNLTLFSVELQASYLHLKCLEFCQESNGHDPEHVICVINPCFNI